MRSPPKQIRNMDHFLIYLRFMKRRNELKISKQLPSQKFIAGKTHQGNLTQNKKLLYHKKESLFNVLQNSVKLKTMLPNWRSSKWQILSQQQNVLNFQESVAKNSNKKISVWNKTVADIFSLFFQSLCELRVFLSSAFSTNDWKVLKKSRFSTSFP